MTEQWTYCESTTMRCPNHKGTLLVFVGTRREELFRGFGRVKVGEYTLWVFKCPTPECPYTKLVSPLDEKEKKIGKPSLDSSP